MPGLKYATAALTMLGLCAILTPAAHAQQQLVTNGSFQSGDFTGWTETDEAGGAGSFFVSNSTSAPVSSAPTVGPDTGDNYYAVSDADGEGAHALTQDISVAPGSTSVIFSFNMFVNDTSGLGPEGTALDYNVLPTQFATVDLLQSGADPLSTDPSDVLENFYHGVDNPGDTIDEPYGYTSYSFDITNLVNTGGTYTIRFGEADNQGVLNMGIDDVSVLDTAPNAIVTPEPSSLIGLAVGVVMISGLILRSRKQAIPVRIKA